MYPVNTSALSPPSGGGMPYAPPGAPLDERPPRGTPRTSPDAGRTAKPALAPAAPRTGPPPIPAPELNAFPAPANGFFFSES
jgi:hypothetical protein